MRQGRERREERTTTNEKEGKKRAFPERFASLRLVSGGGGKYRGISLLEARRTAKEDLTWKSAPGLLRTFRSRALTQTDILFSRGTRVAPRRDHTVVNLIST